MEVETPPPSMPIPGRIHKIEEGAQSLHFRQGKDVDLEIRRTLKRP
jgi:hypothetical protein